MILKDLVARIDDAYKASKQDDVRHHLGASVIGNGCERAVWYSFRWASKSSFEGRMFRLFDRGHDEEPRLIRLLAMVGATVEEVDPATGKQWRITGYKGHFGGSCDGIVYGLDFPAFNITKDTRGLCEFKTHNAKSFQDLTVKGVRGAKPQHYVQMQIYMRKMNLAYGLYVAVCKNDDHLHLELVLPDDQVANYSLSSAEHIIDSPVPPPRVAYAGPSSFKCKFCDDRGPCLMGRPMQKNCRTCSFSTPVEDGEWFCTKWHAVIPKDAQKEGCPSYEAIQPVGG